MVIIRQKAPGLYREDVFPTPIPVLPTGVPVFLGLADKSPDPDNPFTPKQLTLWTQFGEFFGQPKPTGGPKGYLSSAVYGFFGNGGRLCYVVRLPTLNDLEAGLEAAEALTEVDLVCVPDLVGDAQTPAQIQRLQTLVLEHCDRLGDRFAILDAQKTELQSGLAAILQQRRALRGNNGALYAPWIKTARGAWVPPCGHVAGVYARGDRTIGVHHAPANVVLEDVLDLSLDLSTADQVALNPDQEGAGVNCLRSLPGRGIRIWGARTLSGDENWRYINVRRLFITVGRWVERNLAEVAFEPNDVRLWLRIERELTAYLTTLAQQGALQGTTPENAFYVKCDLETNAPELRQAGNVVTEIGLAPTIPNEFIVVRLVHGNTGVVLTHSPG